MYICIFNLLYVVCHQERIGEKSSLFWPDPFFGLAEGVVWGQDYVQAAANINSPTGSGNSTTANGPPIFTLELSIPAIMHM